MNNATDMTIGSVSKLIRSMMLTLTVGSIASVVFGFVDTAFVGQLGETQLAALGYTAPVARIGLSVSGGICIGVSAVVAGESIDHSRVKRIATDAVVLILSITVMLMIAALFCIKPLFYGMGATDVEMPYIKSYMTVWLLGYPASAFSLVGSYVMRGLGNARVPAIVSTSLYLTALLLDPFLILGLWIFPKLGIVGAATAFFVARVSVCAFMFYFLVFKAKLFDFETFSIKRFIGSARRILHVALPNMLIRAILPIGAYIITALLSGYGSNAVAGFGAGCRVGNFVLIITNSLAMVMIPFAGQNLRAGRLDRLRKGFRFSLAANAVYSIAVYTGLFIAAPYIAMLFSGSAEVREIIVLYLRIGMAGFVFQGGALMITSVLNAVRKPLQAALIWVLQAFVIYIPLSFALSGIMGPSGIFTALVISYAVSFGVSYMLLNRFNKKSEQKHGVKVVRAGRKYVMRKTTPL